MDPKRRNRETAKFYEASNSRHSGLEDPICHLVFWGTAVVLRVWHRLLVEWLTDDPINIVRLRILSPIAIMIALLWLQYVFSFQVNIAGRFFNLTESCIVVVFYIAATGAFWATSRAFFETIIVDPRLQIKVLTTVLSGWWDRLSALSAAS